ncbi:hypothetical protein B0H13DRAFT_2492525 [Mycena leptocephala]|nr:hypothetical protein B0H13DRAFT_2492525 [Mycena leptocephala]
MSLSITEFPQDILLELAKRLHVADLLSLLSLCRIARGLQFKRTLWLDTLIRIREVEMQPLPLSTADSVDTLSLSELQNIVRRADRLMKNFQSERPRPFHISKFSVERGASIFFIPGANLIVANKYKGSVSCWDTVTSQRVAHLSNESHSFWIYPSALCTEIMGKALIGGWISDGDLMRLAVICIDFRDRALISISQVISPTTVRRPVPHLFINPQIMGFCTMTDIVSWTMNADAAVQTTPDVFIQAIPRDILGQINVPCLAFGQTLYLFFTRKRTSNATVCSLPFPLLSDIQRNPSDHPGLNTTQLGASNAPEVRLFDPGLRGRIRGPHVFTPHYGIFAVTSQVAKIRRPDSDTELDITLIHFWPGHADPDSDNIEFGPSCFHQHPDRISNLAEGASGTHVLLLVKQRPEQPHLEPYLGLVHFIPLPVPHTTFRKLDTGDVKLSSCRQILLDDSLGVVAIMDDEGQVTTISYV